MGGSEKFGTLKREIGLLDATMIGVGAIVGAGIFVVTGIAAEVAGTAVVMSMLVAAVIASFTAYSFWKLGQHLPKEGGVYQFAHELVSPPIGFITGWMWILSYVFGSAAVSMGFANYLLLFLSTSSVLVGKSIAVSICLAFTFLNYVGIRQSAKLNNALVSAKIATLLFFVVFGLFYVNTANFAPFMPPNGMYGIFQGATLIFFAYVGFARITTMAEEVKEPQKTVPRSMILALAISVVFYLLVSFVAVGVAGAQVLAGSDSPLSTAIGLSGNNLAVSLVSAGAMLATASVLLTAILGVSRVSFAMARNGDLPSFIGKIHSKYGTPHYSVLITGLLVTLAIIFADLTRVVAISSFASLLYYSIANLAALKLSKKSKNCSPMPPIVGLIACLCLLVFVPVDSIAVGLAGLVVGIIYYLCKTNLT